MRCFSAKVFWVFTAFSLVFIPDSLVRAREQETCDQLPRPQALIVRPDETYLVWNIERAAAETLIRVKVSDVSDDARLASSTLWRAFREQVRAQVRPEPFELLARQRAVYARARQFAEVAMFDELLERRVGVIRPISCLEALLFDKHFRLRGATGFFTEFGAFVLERQGRLRVYFFSGKDPSPPQIAPVRPLIERDREGGWRVVGHVHNHLFNLEPNALDLAGTTIPSEVDAKFLVKLATELGMSQAWITNGFSTLELKHDEFSRFLTSSTR